MTLDAKQMEHQLTARRGGVDHLGEGTEPNIARLQYFDRVNQMGQRTAKAIQLPNNQHVDIPHILERGP
jgi:hypothetical protein